jgi:hypothetical protein
MALFQHDNNEKTKIEVFAMNFAKVYPHYSQRQKKGA